MKTNLLRAVTLALFVSAGAYAQTVDEIVDKHVAALGGKEKVQGLKTLVTEQSVSAMGNEFPSTTTLIAGRAMRSETTIMGNSMIQVVDGKTGWSIMPTMMQGTGEPEDMPAPMLQQMTGRLSPFGTIVDYKTNGTKIELVGKEQVDKKDMYHLKMTSPDGQAVDMYLDANTYLTSKIKTSANGMNGEILFSDYKETSGLKFPSTMEIVGNPMGNFVMTTNKVVVNGPVDEAIFKKPAK